MLPGVILAAEMQLALFDTFITGQMYLAVGTLHHQAVVVGPALGFTLSGWLLIHIIAIALEQGVKQPECDGEQQNFEHDGCSNGELYWLEL